MHTGSVLLDRAVRSGSSPSPIACPACGAHETLQLGGFAKRFCANWCDVCTHGFVASHRLQSIDPAVLYDHAYSGFREDPVFTASCRQFVCEELVPRAPKNAAILDVGCGNGEFLCAVRDAGFDAEGFDGSEAAARACLERGISARAGDFLTTEFERAYDTITFWDVLEHLPDPQRFAKRAFELLRPGGLLFAKTPRTGKMSLEVAQLVPRLGGALLQLPAHVQFFTEASLQRLVLRAGFTGTEVLPSRAMRGVSLDRSARKRITRGIISQIQRLSDDGNLMLFARRPNEADT